MNNNNDLFWAAIFITAISMLLGFVVSVEVERRSWEDALVDRPKSIAAIRSRVLAVRAEQESLK